MRVDVDATGDGFQTLAGTCAELTGVGAGLTFWDPPQDVLILSSARPSPLNLATRASPTGRVCLWDDAKVERTRLPADSI